jgi:hypothetical protein
MKFLYRTAFYVSFLPTIVTAQFGSEQVITTSSSISQFMIHDVNGDNNLDLVYMRDFGMNWKSNLKDSSTNVQPLISTNADNFNFIDLDFDGDKDIILKRYLNNQFTWSRNYGFSYGPDSSLFYDNDLSGNNFDVLDIDQDGLDDIIYSDNIPIFFLRDTIESTTFKKVIPGNQLTTFIDYEQADFDADNSLDIISSSGSVYYIEKTGSQSFSSTFVPSSINTGPCQIELLDCNHDGEFDIVSGSSTDQWLFYIPKYGDQLDLNYYLTIDTLVNPNDVLVVDINGDGSKDIVISDGLNDGLYWYENLGPNQFSSRNVITNNFLRPRTLALVDYDHDGVKDLVALSGSSFNEDAKISWFKNMNNSNVGVNQLDFNESNINVFPNPSGGKFNLKSNDLITQLDLIDMHGRLIFTKAYSKKNHIVVESNLEKGVYILRALVNDQFITKLVSIN